MTQANEAPLQQDLGDRRCLRLYLLAAHLLAALTALLSDIDTYWRLWLLATVLASSGYWWWREQHGVHPLTLGWRELEGWRLDYAQRQVPLTRVRHLIFGHCLLLETQSQEGIALFFLAQRPGMNRLRHLLRRSNPGR
jgi:hypothetical protein